MPSIHQTIYVAQGFGKHLPLESFNRITVSCARRRCLQGFSVTRTNEANMTTTTTTTTSLSLFNRPRYEGWSHCRRFFSILSCPRLLAASLIIPTIRPHCPSISTLVSLLLLTPVPFLA